MKRFILALTLGLCATLHGQISVFDLSPPTTGAGSGDFMADGSVPLATLEVTGSATVATNLTVGGQVLAADGTTATPAFSFAGDPDTGIYRSAANTVNIALNSKNAFSFAPLIGFKLASDHSSISWSATTSAGGAIGLSLVREADNTLAQRNALVAQTNRVYGTWTDAANYARAATWHDGVSTMTLAAESEGTGSANQTVRVLTKGAGAFIVDNPDTTAGNARGAYAVDLQLSRNAATQVAIGAYSLLAGYRGIASAASSVSMGAQNISSGEYALTYGRLCTASGRASTAGGEYATATATGQRSYASGRFAADGDAQTLDLRARAVSALNVATNLTLSGGALAAGSSIALPNNTTWIFKAQIVGHSLTAGTPRETAGYTIEGGITRGADAAATAIVGTPVTTVLWETDAAWDVAVAADTTNGALDLKATGNDEAAVRWVATLYITQVGGTE